MSNTFGIKPGYIVFDYSEADTAMRYKPKANREVELTNNGTTVEETYTGGKLDYDEAMRKKIQACHAQWRNALNVQYGLPLAAETGKFKDGIRFMTPERFAEFQAKHVALSAEMDRLNQESADRAAASGAKLFPSASLRYQSVQIEANEQTAQMLFESVRGIAAALRDAITSGDWKVNQRLRDKRAKNAAELTTYVAKRNVERMIDLNLDHQEMVRMWQGEGNDGAPPAGTTFTVKKGAKQVSYFADYSIYDLVITEHSEFGQGVTSQEPAGEPETASAATPDVHEAPLVSEPCEPAAPASEPIAVTPPAPQDDQDFDFDLF